MDRREKRGIPALGVRWPELVLAAVVVGLVILGTNHITAHGAERAVDGLAFATGIAGGAALTLWRRCPYVTGAVVTVAITVYLARHYPSGPSLLPGPLALLLIGYRLPRRIALAAAATLSTCAIAGQWIGTGRVDVVGLLTIGWTLAAVFAGQLVASRAERLVTDREREAFRRQRAVSDERLRIAQDLHDSVAHAMATISVQSGVAAHLLERAGPGADTDQLARVGGALRAIQAASGDVLDELGTILNGLRASDSAVENGGLPPVARAPTAGLERLDDLVERARHDGLTVTLHADGPVTTVLPSLSVAAYRVVQEALSNVRRHSGPGTAVSVRVLVTGGDRLRVEIDDDGGRPVAGLNEAATGLGLIGMRERVTTTGGALQTGATDQGFRVLAEWAGRSSR